MNYAEWMQRRREEEALALEIAEWEFKQDVAKAEAKRAAKRLKAMKKARPAMFRPDAPLRYTVEVVLLVRPGNAWKGEAPTALAITIVGVMSETQAQVEAIQKAKELGYVWAGTATTTLVIA